MSNPPVVEIHRDIANKAYARELKKIIEAAVLKLHVMGAWRDDFGLASIMIFKEGMSTPNSKPTGMQTQLPFDEMAPDGVIRRALGLPVIIEVSLNLFKNEMGAKMVALGATKEEVVFHILAHETHHIDEIERMSACGVLYDDRLSSFAGAARPDFPADWKDAVQELTKQYKDDQSLTGGLIAAAHIANEASADLVGLYWMKQNGMDWRKFGERLVHNRKEAKNAEAKRSSSILLSALKDPIPFYDIGEQIEAMIAKGLPDIQSIYSECWNMAIDKALGLQKFQDPSRAIFRKLKPLALPAQARNVAAPATIFEPGNKSI
jgi:hypothetical protein